MDWAYEECSTLDLGDRRRTAVARGVLRAASEHPAGTVTEVCRSAPFRQAAYKFLESPFVTHEPLQAAFASATARRVASLPYVFVAVDGSSLALADHAGTKFGSVGSYKQGGRGMKVINAYAVAPDGQPVGLLAQQWWTRIPRKRSHAGQGPPAKRETVHWCRSIETAKRELNLAAPQSVPWFVIDREGDGFHVLGEVVDNGLFTVRANANRRVLSESSRQVYVNDVLAKTPVRGVEAVQIAGSPRRQERVARMSLRVCSVTLDLIEPWTKKKRPLRVNLVELRETRTTPRGEKPLLWRLYTNHPVKTLKQIRTVVSSYRARWRIEEFHRTWKTGACNVEDSQLRSAKTLLTWATLMATVAVRVERLKAAARSTPEAPASVELSEFEQKAVLLLKRKYRSRAETIPRRIPDIGTAVRWIAELGGYTGKSSGGPPGSITIRRGLEDVLIAAQVIEALEHENK